MAPPARTARANNETRELILRSALPVFAVKGFDGATTREIATAAGVNHGLIPYYFGTKVKLWEASVDLAFGDMASGLEELISDDSIASDRERARQMIRVHVRYVAAHPEFVRVMHEEGKRDGPRTRWLVDRHVRPLYDAIVGVLARGELDLGISPIHFFYVLVGSVGVIFHQAEECKRLTGVDPFDPEVVEEHARVVERLLLGPER